ncbi:MAG: TetR/AcrR family transcriptional regulator [Chloroflexota bacterium]
MRTRREKILDITREEIKITARSLMAEKGTAGLSIRAIAREMKMSAPALYHYYDSLNELITALIQDAFVRLADAQEAVANDPQWQNELERLTAVASSYRQWALDNPIDFQLIYGNPIPNYEQPTEVTYPPARRSFILTASIIANGIEKGEIVLPETYRNFPEKIEQSLAALTQIEGHDLPHSALYLAASAWAKIHGFVMLELFHLIQPVIGNVDEFFQYELTQFLKNIDASAED